ncbi:Uncharacterised protein [Kluyvera cryocrescens]|uniref:Uncharacterized protein n=1 Tax=Kluyvera cryocrescens TaxID=580 RepID=A0A485AXW9_KLUCR|nr:Uncharacterised protein [Kluyvera cryocrescens]
MRHFSFSEGLEIGLFFGLLLLCLALQFTLCYFWCRRKLGWSKDEALLGAVPGRWLRCWRWQRIAKRRRKKL